MSSLGILKGVCITDAISALTDVVVKQLNDKIKVARIFLDLSSVFDTGEQELLLVKLKNSGVKDKVSYLNCLAAFDKIQNDLYRSNISKIIILRIIDQA